MAVSGNFARFLRSPSFKFALIGCLVFAISIPLALVWVMLSERQNRAGTVRSEIAQDWGRGQRIIGPYLIVPYSARTILVDAGKQVEVERERLAIFLPDIFNASAEANTEIRRRSIYNVTVYRSNILIEGRFPEANIAPLDTNAIAARWQDAYVALGISDVSGLKNNVELEGEDGKLTPFEPSIGAGGTGYQGIHARVTPNHDAGKDGLKSSSPLSFKIKLALNGSSFLRFAPVGRDTSVSIKSNWPHPSFVGFLPVARTIAANGFSADWRIPHLARSVPQSWVEGTQNMTLDRFTSADLGVNLFVPVDFYSLVERSLKYGFMVIATVFGAVFVLELLSHRRVHPIQYIFAGLAIVIFFVLLLALSEHLGFTSGYIIGAAATSAMISVYVGKVFASLRRGLLILGIFAVLYGLLYFILQLEDYALLAGAAAAFLLLTATMFATMGVNWEGEDPQTSP
jgi:inner membrane protein